MSKLDRLGKKRSARVQSRERHYRLYEKHRAAGHKHRAAWHLNKFKADKKAIRKLDRLIEAEKDRIRAARKIDWNDHPHLTFEPLLKAIRKALTVEGLYVTATSDGNHTPTSWHYKERASDFGSDKSDESPEIKAQNLLLKTFGASYFRELFGPAGWYVKDGVLKPGTFPGHGDHLHVAVA